MGMFGCLCPTNLGHNSYGINDHMGLLLCNSWNQKWVVQSKWDTCLSLSFQLCTKNIWHKSKDDFCNFLQEWMFRYWGDNKLIDIAFTQFLMAKTRNLPLLYIPKEYRMLDLESLGHDFVKDINVGGTNSNSFIFFHA